MTSPQTKLTGFPELDQVSRPTRRKRVKQYKSLLEKGQQYPRWWVREVLGAKLWHKQEEILRSIRDHERTSVPAAFGVGKTFIAAHAAHWFLYNHYPSKVISTAPTNRQVKDLLWREIRTAHKKALRPLGGTMLTQELTLDEEWFATGFATKDYDPDRFTGYHAPSILVIFDQSAGIPRAIWEAAEGLMTSAHVRWLAIGNTTDASSEFANICMPDRVSDFGHWNNIHIPADMSPNVKAGKNLYPGLVAYDWVQKRSAIWPPGSPLFRIFVKAEFVDSSEMVLIPSHQVSEMLKNEDVEPDYDDIRIGVDVAWTGTDMTVWHVMAGPRLLTVKIDAGNNDPSGVARETLYLCGLIESKTGVKVSDVRVDVIGIGAGVYSRCIEYELPTTAINSAERADDAEHLANVRAEMGWALRQSAEAGDISFKPLWPTEPTYVDMLRQELLAIRYKIDPSGRIILEKKDELKKRLRRSPNFYDAAAMSGAGAGFIPQISFVNTIEMSAEEREEAHQEFEDKLFARKFDIEEDFQDVDAIYH